MISILVPLFNVEVWDLINELNRQLCHLNVDGEILVFDDASSNRYRELNKSISNLDRVIYRELDKNYGRTDIRKLLASYAKYDWLLFIDSDSRIIHSDYVQRYISSLNTGYDTYVGGRVYPPKPGQCNKALHWKYGVKRESLKGNKTAFHSNNFCIKKDVFEQIKFPAILKQYGHEDTWMGMELERLGKKVTFIFNTIEHTLIEDTKIFLEKTDQALRNLLLLQEISDKRKIANHVSLFSTYLYLQKAHLEFTVTLFYNVFKNKILRNLNSCNPSLFFFDVYRLYNLIVLAKQFR